MLHELAREVFARLCHQEPERAWAFAGVALPLCARCTGVYAGMALAVLALPFARFEPARRILWLHGLAMLQMLLAGLHLAGPQVPWARTLSGALFALGAVYFLFQPLRLRMWPRHAGRPWTWALAAAAVPAVLIALVSARIGVAGAVVEVLALSGLAVAPALVVADVIAVLSARPHGAPA